MTENQENLVDLGNKVVGQIVLPSIDISPYVGKMVKVADVKEYEGNYGYYIRITTEAVATLDQKDKDGNPIVLKASRMFGLQTDAEGQIGWGEKTLLGNFLKKKKLSHYRDLIGVEVVTTSVTNKDDGKDYLSFN
jgi:RNase P/RNase MRP subunit p29